MKKPAYTEEELEELKQICPYKHFYPTLIYDTPYEDLPLKINECAENSLYMLIIKWRLRIGK